jgi:hypothetical protein
MIITQRASQPQFLPESRPPQPHNFSSFQGTPISNVRMSDPQPAEQSYMMDVDSEVLTTNVNGYRAPFPIQSVHVDGVNDNRPLDAW